jgi:hypothetical protein
VREREVEEAKSLVEWRGAGAGGGGNEATRLAGQMVKWSANATFFCPACGKKLAGAGWSRNVQIQCFGRRRKQAEREKNCGA